MTAILVTGSAGILGSAVMKELSRAGRPAIGLDLLSPDPACRVDLADWKALRRLPCWENAALVLHLAGATDVDRCETDPAFARRMNAEATDHIARLCAQRDIPLVYMSTAMVFGGIPKREPYVEDDPIAPANAYARSKYEGEEAVRRATPRHFIVRTAWVMGGDGEDKKFVGKIVRQVREGRGPILAVSDKRGSPTYAADLARNLLELAGSGRYGTYHMANRGACTRYDMARFIVQRLGGAAEVEAVPSSRFPLPAPRPESEALDNRALGLWDLDRMRPWREALAAHLDTLEPAIAKARRNS